MASTTPPPEVSVALCTFNGERYLRQQLDSVLAQQDVALDVVALDDGSTDATGAILDEYATRDPRLRWQANPRNLGPTASFERAMALCRGPYIAPCDQDDVWQPRKLAELRAAVGDADLVYCDSVYVDAQGRASGGRVSQATAMLAGTNPIAWLFTNSVSGHASLVRRDLFEQARPFPVGAYHDWWLALCAAGRNGVRYLDRALVEYRRHENAHSGMGRSSSGRSRTAAASRTWLDERHALMQAYAGTSLRRHEIAAALAQALDEALGSGRGAPLRRLLWRHRDLLPAWTGIAALDAFKLQRRLATKLRRARMAG